MSGWGHKKYDCLNLNARCIFHDICVLKKLNLYFLSFENHTEEIKN